MARRRYGSAVATLKQGIRPALKVMAAAAAKQAAFQQSKRGHGINRAKRGLMLATGELKSIDTTVSLQMNLTAELALLNGCQRGADIGNRIGRQILMKSIHLKGIASVTPTTGADQFHRILVVYDRQANAAALTAAQVMSAAGNGYDVIRPRNLENRERFTVLMDQTFRLNAAGESGSSRLIDFYRKLNHPVTFNATDGATIADIVTGSLYVVGMGNQTLDGNNFDGDFNGICRIRFQDN